MSVKIKATEVTIPGTIGKKYDKGSKTTTLNLNNEQVVALVSDLAPIAGALPSAVTTPGWVSTPVSVPNGPQAMATSSA
jgi:hypothetical protein